MAFEVDNQLPNVLLLFLGIGFLNIVFVIVSGRGQSYCSVFYGHNNAEIRFFHREGNSKVMARQESGFANMKAKAELMQAVEHRNRIILLWIKSTRNLNIDKFYVMQIKNGKSKCRTLHALDACCDHGFRCWLPAFMLVR